MSDVLKFLLILFSVVVFIVVVVAYLLNIRLYRVFGDSMYPTYTNGKYVPILLSNNKEVIERGDVIVFYVPDDSYKSPYMARVIGLPGEIVRIKNGKIYVNNHPLDDLPNVISAKKENYDIYDWVEKYKIVDLPAHKVIDDGYFVLSDNLPIKLDSREFEDIPEEYIVGKVMY